MKTKKNTKKPQMIQETTLDIFLMLNKKVSVKEIQDIINQNFSDMQSDIWQDLNIMELQINPDKTIDWIEMKDTEAFSDEDKAMINSKGVECVYCITHEPEDIKIVLDIAKILLEKYDGIIGNDTDDFEPIFDKNTMKDFNY